MTGSGKSYLCNFILQNAQKYEPLTFIFDIGGSFESLTTIFGGSLPERRPGGARLHHQSVFACADQGEPAVPLQLLPRADRGQRPAIPARLQRRIKLWDAIERIYMLEAGQRTLSNFANIIGELKDRLYRWTRAGQYGFLFDNAEDTLSFSEFQTFNFAGWGDAPEVLEPLLFYVLHRASQRNLRSAEARPPSKCSCSTRHGSSSRTRPSATTSSRRRRRGASTRLR